MRKCAYDILHDRVVSPPQSWLKLETLPDNESSDHVTLVCIPMYAEPRIPQLELEWRPRRLVRILLDVSRLGKK